MLGEELTDFGASTEAEEEPVKEQTKPVVADVKPEAAPKTAEQKAQAPVKKAAGKPATNRTFR